MSTHKPSVKKLQEELKILRKQLRAQKDIEASSKLMLEELKQKEEFNFALFQYSPVTTVIVDKKGKVVKSNRAKRRTGDRLPSIGDIMYRDYANKHTKNMYEELMERIKTGTSKKYNRMHYGNRILNITIAPFPQGAIITTQDITDEVIAEKERVKLIGDLRRALDEVETLRSLLPICSSCKKIRDDTGYWNTVEEYFSERTKFDFSHTVCPDCFEQLYPDVWLRMKEQKQNIKS